MNYIYNFKTTSKTIKFLFLIIGILVILIFLMKTVFYKNKSNEITSKKKFVPSPYVITKSYSVITKNVNSWQNYINEEKSFLLSYPADWTLKFKQSELDKKSYKQFYSKGLTVQGKEGSVDVSWTNKGYGGGCPAELKVYILKNGKKFIICHYLREDGSEYFGQIYKLKESLDGEEGVITYAQAIIAKPIEENRDMVLSVLTSLKFY